MEGRAGVDSRWARTPPREGSLVALLLDLHPEPRAPLHPHRQNPLRQHIVKINLLSRKQQTVCLSTMQSA
jgi:hypothetical protein